VVDGRAKRRRSLLVEAVLGEANLRLLLLTVAFLAEPGDVGDAGGELGSSALVALVWEMRRFLVDLREEKGEYGQGRSREGRKDEQEAQRRIEVTVEESANGEVERWERQGSGFALSSAARRADRHLDDARR
jgi:hypothetical protein